MAVAMRLNFLQSSEEKHALICSLNDFIKVSKDLYLNPLQDHIKVSFGDISAITHNFIRLMNSSNLLMQLLLRMHTIAVPKNN